MAPSLDDRFVPLSLATPVWERVFTVAPLVVVGTAESDGDYDLAPKHMAMPLGWDHHYGFVCTPRHRTYHNAGRTGEFTISYPRPTQIVFTSMSAAPRCEDGTKPTLANLPTVAAREVDGVFLTDAYLCLACKLEQIIDGFGEHSLVVGRIVAAYAAADSLRDDEQDANDLLQEAPLLAYLNWGRFARIEKSHAFPFVRGFQR